MPSPNDTFWLNISDHADEIEDASTTLMHQLTNVTNRYGERTEIARGGMKIISSCRDQKTGRDVAMASVRDSTTPVVTELFLREARILAHLQHPNIVPVYDIGLIDADTPFFTMKLIRGDSLQERLDAKSAQLIDHLDTFVRICDGIAYAHSQSILHLDLKPDNIQLSHFGEVLICDWGLARIKFDGLHETIADDRALDLAQAKHLTLSGEIKGTPGFLAPEQAEAQSKSKKDERTDIYALGAILYNILTGQAPLSDLEIPEIIDRTKHGQIPQVTELKADVSASLAAICAKAMQTKPDDRYQTVGQLRADLTRYLHGFPAAAERPSLFVHIEKFYQRHKRACLSAALVVAISGAALSAFLSELKDRDHALKQSNQTAENLTQQVITERQDKEAISKVATEERHTKRLAARLAIHDLEKLAIDMYRSQKLTEADRVARLILEVDPTNKTALSQSTRSAFIQQKFNICATHAAKLSPNLKKPENPNDLAALCQGRKETNRFSPDELERILQTADFKSRGIVFCSTISHAIATYLPLESHLPLFRTTLNWANAPHSINKVRYDHQAASLDLSGNPSLENIVVLVHIPLRALDLSGSKTPDLAYAALPTLQRLALRNVKQIDLKPLTGSLVSELDLRGSTIKAPEVLAAIPRLKKVRITKGQVTPAILAKLRKRATTVVISEPTGNSTTLD